MKVGSRFVIYEVSEYLPRYTNNASMMRPELFGKIDHEKGGYLSKKGKREEEQQIRVFREPLENSINQLVLIL